MIRRVIRTSIRYTIYWHVVWKHSQRQQCIRWCAVNTSTIRGKLILFWKRYVDVTSVYFSLVCSCSCSSCAGARQRKRGDGDDVPKINCLYNLSIEFSAFSTVNCLREFHSPTIEDLVDAVLRSISESKRSVINGRGKTILHQVGKAFTMSPKAAFTSNDGWEMDRAKRNCAVPHIDCLKINCNG